MALPPSGDRWLRSGDRWLPAAATRSHPLPSGGRRYEKASTVWRQVATVWRQVSTRCKRSLFIVTDSDDKRLPEAMAFVGTAGGSGRRTHPFCVP
jgi:hypothetical protein